MFSSFNFTTSKIGGEVIITLQRQLSKHDVKHKCDDFQPIHRDENIQQTKSNSNPKNHDILNKEQDITYPKTSNRETNLSVIKTMKDNSSETIKMEDN